MLNPQEFNFHHNSEATEFHTIPKHLVLDYMTNHYSINPQYLQYLFFLFKKHFLKPLIIKLEEAHRYLLSQIQKNLC